MRLRNKKLLGAKCVRGEMCDRKHVPPDLRGAKSVLGRNVGLSP